MLTTKTIRDMGRANEHARMSGAYIDRERSWLNEAVKATERPRVAAFLLRHHKPGQQFRLLSLPSIHWSFERLLVETGGERQWRFFGFEWSWGVMELGRAYMPGGRSFPHTLKLAIGNVEGFVAGGGKDESLASQWLWCHVGHFLSIQRTDKNKRDNKHFARVYKRMSAVWLDFTSQMCDEVRLALSHVGSHCDSAIPAVPVAVTMMAARDEHNSDASRVDEVCRQLSRSKWRTFKLTDSWTYVHNGIPMLTVCGLAWLRPSPWPTPDEAVRMHRRELR